jgi:hypothetical protein
VSAIKIRGEHGPKTGPDRRPRTGKTIDRDRTECGRSGLGPVRSGPVFGRSGPIRHILARFFGFLVSPDRTDRTEDRISQKD